MDRDIPCRVSSDLRAYERNQERAEREWENSEPERRLEAEDALEEPEQLKTVLNDEEFAAPLSRMFRNIERAFKGDVDARDAVLQSVQAMKIQCFDKLMGRE